MQAARSRSAARKSIRNGRSLPEISPAPSVDQFPLLRLFFSCVPTALENKESIQNVMKESQYESSSSTGPDSTLSSLQLYHSIRTFPLSNLTISHTCFTCLFSRPYKPLPSAAAIPRFAPFARNRYLLRPQSSSPSDQGSTEPGRDPASPILNRNGACFCLHSERICSHWLGLRGIQTCSHGRRAHTRVSGSVDFLLFPAIVDTPSYRICTWAASRPLR